ncbi:hypothetical protein YC2023_096511 [Brassica napus]
MKTGECIQSFPKARALYMDACVASACFCHLLLILIPIVYFLHLCHHPTSDGIKVVAAISNRPFLSNFTKLILLRSPSYQRLRFVMDELEGPANGTLALLTSAGCVTKPLEKTHRTKAYGEKKHTG